MLVTIEKQSVKLHYSSANIYKTFNQYLSSYGGHLYKILKNNLIDYYKNECKYTDKLILKSNLKSIYEWHSMTLENYL